MVLCWSKKPQLNNRDSGLALRDQQAPAEWIIRGKTMVYQQEQKHSADTLEPFNINKRYIIGCCLQAGEIIPGGWY